MKMSAILAGVALAASMSVANAGEPIKLSVTQMDDVTAGSYYCDVCFTKKININENHKKQKKKTKRASKKEK